MLAHLMGVKGVPKDSEWLRPLTELKSQKERKHRTQTKYIPKNP